MLANIKYTSDVGETVKEYVKLIRLFVQLIAGSGISPEKDEELNAPRDERDENSVDATEENHPSSSDNSEDQYSAGIPGPLTRLFILANRGISSLIQDIIIVSCSRKKLVLSKKLN